MTNTQYLIIGGGIAGTSAAEVIRQNDSDGRIIIVSDEPYRLYSRIMLSKPNFFLGKIPFENIYLKTPEFYTENKIELLTNRKAVKLDVKNKTIELNDKSIISYDKLLLALGTCARYLDVKGKEKGGIFALRTLDDAKGIIETIKAAKKAVTVGGGFISFEICDMLKKAGLEVTLVIREPYYWANLLDEESGTIIENAIEAGGVKIIKNEEIAEILGNDNVEGVITKNSGETIPCQIITIGVGAFCPLNFIETTDIKKMKGLKANEYLELSVPDVWTAGDVAEFKDVILNEQVILGNWANAQMQGRIAGLNMAGKKTMFKMVSSYTSSSFGVSIAFLGNVRTDEDKEVIKRGSREINSLGRFILKDGKLIGATLINRTQELPLLSKLVEQKIDLTSKKEELADLSFDLKKLI